MYDRTDSYREATEIKFAEVLAHLIEQSPFKANRKPIWHACNITSAALSQYLKGETRPRLETLAALANFFGVTVDYLLFGTEHADRHGGLRPFQTYVENALAESDARSAQRQWLVGRITDALSRQIDTTATRLASRMESRDGIITDDDLAILETEIVEAKLAVAELTADVLLKDEGAPVPGRFASIVAANLKQRPIRSYKFLLPPWQHDAATQVHSFRRLLSDQFGVAQEMLASCEFRRAQTDFFAGAVLYRLQPGALQERHPALMEMLSPYITETRHLGYVTHFQQSRHTMLFTAPHVQNAVESFDRLWAAAAGI